MTSGLIYGGRVIQHLESIPEIGSTLVIVRHSERPSFQNVPVEEWDHVTITERGKQAAKSFGRVVAEKRMNHTLRVHSWGLKRCVETAECIATGAKEVGYHTPEVTPLRFRGPVSDLEGYNNLMRRGIWSDMLSGWLGRGSYESLVPLQEYAQEILGHLLSDGFCGPRETTIIATHDIHIIPLVSFLNGKPLMKADFLDGMVLKSDGKNAHIGFESQNKLVSHGDVFKRPNRT